MDERWCSVVNRAVMVMLLVGYVPMQAAVNDGQQGERCTTSSSKAGYCMPKERCNEKEIVDLRTGVPCTDPSLYCCTNVESNAPSWSRKKQYTECDSNKGYCVKSDMCSVRTFRLRSNRCPSYEEVCCPKSAFSDEPPVLYKVAVTTPGAPGTTTSTVTAASVVAATPDATATTTLTTPASSTVDTTTPQPATSSTTTIKQIDSSSTKPPSDPSTDEDCFECGELSSADQTTATSTEAVRTIATTTDSIRASMTSTTEANQEEITVQIVDQTGLDEHAFVENPIDRPSSLVPPAADTSDTSTALLEKFTPDTFTYQTCGQSNPDGVVERQLDQPFRAEYGEFPWTVALLQLPERRYCCNGALIDNNAIVTTAHCVGNCGNQVDQIVVRVGEWNMSATADAAIPRQDIGVKRKHIHPDFGVSSLINNIAVLELKESVQYQPTIQPVCLPSPAYTLRSQENMVATGWGATIADGNAAFSNILKRLDLRHVQRSICKDKLQTVQRPYGFQLHQSLVCADTSHSEQERPCKGDAGSPVVIEIPNTINTHYLYGLVSWGFDCKQQSNLYTALTHVAFFRTWIDGILQKPKKKSKPGKY